MMEEQVLILFDTELEYAQSMSDFLRAHRDAPWEIRTYTSEEELLEREKKTKISMLAVAESAYSERLNILRTDTIVILNESGVFHLDHFTNIDKYQQAEKTLKEMLLQYMNVVRAEFPKLTKFRHTRFIGVYSPVRRCLQTSVALSMCQMLAMEHRTLYLNFQHYMGITELLPDMQDRDLADLLYFLTADKDRFHLRLQTMIKRKGNLEYIPPMKSGQNLLTITSAEWIGLMQRIEEMGEYEYVVLDLSESMQGLFEILRLCCRIYTMTKDDPVSQRKLLQYEQVLALYDYQDVINKTSRHSIPKIRRYPNDLEQYTKGELAEYVKALLKEIGA